MFNNTIEETVGAHQADEIRHVLDMESKKFVQKFDLDN